MPLQLFNARILMKVCILHNLSAIKMGIVFLLVEYLVCFAWFWKDLNMEFLTSMDVVLEFAKLQRYTLVEVI